MIKETTYFVINLESVKIEKEHPYTLVFEGWVPTYGNNKSHTFKYDGSIAYTTMSMPDKVQKDFVNQLLEDYGCGIKFDLKKVKKQLKSKSQYRMEM